MKQLIYAFQLWIIGDKEAPSYIISEDEGQRLMMMLAGRNCPKFVIIHGEMISTGSIKKLARIPNYIQGPKTIYILEDGKRVGKETYGSFQEERELTEKELKTKELFEKFIGKGQELRLLEDA